MTSHWFKKIAILWRVSIFRKIIFKNYKYNNSIIIVLIAKKFWNELKMANPHRIFFAITQLLDSILWLENCNYNQRYFYSFSWVIFLKFMLLYSLFLLAFSIAIQFYNLSLFCTASYNNYITMLMNNINFPSSRFFYLKIFTSIQFCDLILLAVTIML